MSQNSHVASFRKRLFNRGYRDISILSIPAADSAFPLYFVSYREPVFDQVVSGFLTELQMTKISCRVLSGKK